MLSRTVRHARVGPIEALESRTLLSAFFVSPSGNDSAAGTTAAPWKTLQHAANAVGAGDTVTVRAGHYAGFQMDDTQGGTSSARVTFTAEAGAIIDTGTSRGDGVNLEGASFVTIEGFTISGVSHAGIRSVTNDGVIIRNNVVQDAAYCSILTGFSDHVVVENNVAAGGRNGIYIGNATVSPVVRGNESYDHTRNGIHMNGDISLGGSGLITGALVENNVVHDTGSDQGSGINLDGVQNSVIRNNLLYNNHSNGISLHVLDAAAPSRNDLVANNTVIDTRYWALQFQAGATGNTAVNNVLYTHAAYGSRGALLVSADSRSGMASDYNAVQDLFNTDGDENEPRTLAQWRSATGQDAHSFVATPEQLFVNVAGDDYHLKAGSPGINTGGASLAGKAAPPADLAGAPRPQGGAWDVGAYEFGGAAPDTTAPVISAVASLGLSGTAFRITWTTNESSDSQVDYGTTSAYGSQSARDASLATGHSVQLSGLSAGTLYHYRVRTRDAAGNLSLSADQTFTTPTASPTDPPPPAPGPGDDPAPTPVGDFGVVDDRNARLTFTDGDGTVITAVLTGGGTAQAFIDGGRLTIDVTGTTDKSSLSLSAKRGTGDGRITLGDIRVHGALRALNAAAADLGGAFATDGPVGTVNIGRLAGGVIDSAGSRVTFVDGDGTVVTVALIGGGLVRATPNGDAMDLEASGTGTRSVLLVSARRGTGDGRVTVGDVQVGGALRAMVAPAADLAGTFSATGSLGLVTLGAIHGGTLASGGSILAVSVRGDVTGGRVLAGVGSGADGLFGTADDAVAAAVIRRLGVGGNVTASVFAAGVAAANGVFGDAGDTVAGGAASGILAVSVRGTVDDATTFESGLFGKARITGAAVVPLTDVHFVTLA